MMSKRWMDGDYEGCKKEMEMDVNMEIMTKVLID